ncbi:hydrolase, TatD family [Jonquetella sp. BV3C21]|nr:hydrolase, TatD family [Jonquetella sp. BV3C21]
MPPQRRPNFFLMTYIDSHCHLNSPELESLMPDELDACSAANVRGAVIVGTTLDDSRQAISLCRRWGGRMALKATAGVHPHETSALPDGWTDQLKELLGQPETAALGEIGLDYHYNLSPRDRQLDALRLQLRLAGETKKPVVFHVREAYGDFWAVTDSEPTPCGAVLHCFDGTSADAAAGLERGWFIGVTGAVTFASRDELRETLGGVPLESLLVETDCPYMAPVPFRGKTNRPSWVPLVYSKLAGVKNVSVGELAEAVRANAARLFGLEVL